MSAMLRRVVLLVCAGIVLCKPESVTRKLCKDVDTSQCTVQTLAVDPCPLGPMFCIFKRDKTYRVTLDMTPHFSARNLNIAVTADVDNDESFRSAIKSPGDACGLLSCPLNAEERQVFGLDLKMDKRASGKFPVKIKLWNEDDEGQACCVTFNAKVNK